jgi:RNA polymerase sigma-70 factor (ECF subfamily)
MEDNSPKLRMTEKTETSAVNQRMNANLVAIGTQRDETAFSEVYGHFAGRIKSFLMSRSMEDSIAEELVQEIMLLVWRRAESFDPKKAAASTWIYTIARNRRIDYLRGNSRIDVEFEDEMLELDDDEVTQEQRVDLAQRSEILLDALERLPQEQQQVMHLSYFRGQSHGAIAEWLGLPIGTVKSRIRLAMKSIRNDLETIE